MGKALGISTFQAYDVGDKLRVKVGLSYSDGVCENSPGITRKMLAVRGQTITVHATFRCFGDLRILDTEGFVWLLRWIERVESA